MEAAEVTKRRIKLFLSAKIRQEPAKNLEVMLRPFMDSEKNRMTIRGFKMFLAVTLGRAFAAHEIENFADRMDPDGDGFITW